MALEAPLPSATNLPSPFSSYSDMSTSTSVHSDTQLRRSPYKTFSTPLPIIESSDSRRPYSVSRLSNNMNNLLSPNDIVGPSPVTSNGTEITEIEDDMSEDLQPFSDVTSDSQSTMPSLSTNLDHLRQASDEAVSVIHAPESFKSWKSSDTKSPETTPAKSSPLANTTTLAALNGETWQFATPPPRPPLSTNVKPVKYSIDSATPRAQSLQDFDKTRRRSSSSGSLEKIDELAEADAEADDSVSADSPEGDALPPLRAALQECWTLCNTLANLSSIHRAKIFSTSGTPDSHERAWKTCWLLCKRLYDDQDEEAEGSAVRVDLDLCRDFCQSLFEIRQRRDEATDSVLRVSFELNNHLFSAQDTRNLPDDYRERTLDFYVTICHRLMKQRSDPSDETDQLLRACWTLTEMLFGIRQNRRKGKRADEELLGSAVQACWDLCDIFRDGWRQFRPERNTPRQAHMSPFSSSAFEQSGRDSRASGRASGRSSPHSKRDSFKLEPREERAKQVKPPPVPETPVTEFEDTPISPESEGLSPRFSNIMVLGANTAEPGRNGRWSSNTSSYSGYSHSSARTSSTSTAKTVGAEDANVTRIKILLLRAAMNVGFTRDAMTDSKAGTTMLHKYILTLPATAFGVQSEEAELFQQYKTTILTEAIIPRNHSLPHRGKRVGAYDMARAVHSLTGLSSRYNFLRDLFTFVFQFPIEQVELNRSVSIVV